jgi:hypothetical protein
MALSNKCHFSQPIATALTVLTQQVVAKADLFDNAIANCKLLRELRGFQQSTT